MKAIALAWRVSKPWMRVTAIIIIALVLLNLVGAIYRALQPQAVLPPAVQRPAVQPGYRAMQPQAVLPPAVQPTSQVQDAEKTATHTCWDAIEESATNRSSVEFHSFTSPPVVRRITNSQLEVFVKFSAKNGFGSESTSIARCVVSADGATLVEITAQDSR